MFYCNPCFCITKMKLHIAAAAVVYLQNISGLPEKDSAPCTSPWTATSHQSIFQNMRSGLVHFPGIAALSHTGACHGTADVSVAFCLLGDQARLTA